MRKIAAVASLLSKFRGSPPPFKLPQPKMASSFTSFEEVEDWDRPFTDAELQAIDDAFQYADETPCATNNATATSSSSPTKNRDFSTSVSTDIHSKTRRRLPDSLFLFQRQNASSYNSYHTKVSFSLSRSFLILISFAYL